MTSIARPYLRKMFCSQDMLFLHGLPKVKNATEAYDGTTLNHPLRTYWGALGSSDSQFNDQQDEILLVLNEIMEEQDDVLA